MTPYAHPSTYELPFASHSDTSRDAALARFVGPQGRAVLAYIEECEPERGATQKEIAAGLQVGRASVAARVHALEQQGKLRKSTARRDGCAVYTLSRVKRNGDQNDDR